MPIPIQAPVPKRIDVFNPNAKPFVFASGNCQSGSFSQLAHGPQISLQPQHQQQPHISQPQVFGRAHGTSFGRLSMSVRQNLNWAHSHSRRRRMCPSSRCHSLRQSYPLGALRHPLPTWSRVRCTHNRATRNASIVAQLSQLPLKQVMTAGA